MDTIQTHDEFLLNPKVLNHFTLLQEIGVFDHIKELNQEVQSYKGLLAGAVDIFNRTGIDEIMDAAVRQLSDLFLPSFIVFLWKPHQNKEDVIVRGYKNRKMVDMAVKINTLTVFEPFFQRRKEPVRYQRFSKALEDQRSSERVEEVFQAFEKLQPELVIPILGPSGLYGLILVGPKIILNAYNDTETNYMGQLMCFVTQAIQNHLHYERSVRDVKTGLFNHGFFSIRLGEEISRAKRTGVDSSLIVIDVDLFKLFNDNYGHLAGDRVLEHLALTIKQSVRLEDIPSRFGGEEFTILLPNTDEHAAFMAAERLRIAVAAMEVPWKTPLPQVTISLGLLTFNGEITGPADAILHWADEALYQSKADGRNRTTVWMQA